MFQLSGNSVALSEDQGNSNWFQNVEFCHVYHQSKLERNQLMSIQKQANVKHILMEETSETSK